MATKSSTVEKTHKIESENGVAFHRDGSDQHENGSASQPQLAPSIPARLMPKLPTFPLDYGWRTVYDEVTQRNYDVPLTLRDVLFPTEDDVEVVYISQGPTHNLLILLITELLRLHLDKSGWYFPNDVLIRWGVPGVVDKSPDIAAIPNSGVPSDDKKSFVVGRDGPIPSAIIEITSESTREDDFILKRDVYASVGVKEYLIIDLWEDSKKPWQLHGYRLEDSPRYVQIQSDGDHGVTLETLGLRFVAVDRSRIEIYDCETGERLCNATEYMVEAEQAAARAEEEATRAKDEAERANAAEARVKELEKILQELKKD